MAQTYPHLKWKCIISNLEKCVPELKIRSHDYMEPNKDFWVRAYQMLLPKLLDTPYEELFPPNLHMKYNMDEYYEQAIVITFVLRHMQTAMEICKYHDFNFRDCIFPDKIRLQEILSACCNYFTFKDSRVKIIEEKIELRESKLQALDSLKTKNAEMKTMIAVLYNNLMDNNMEQINKEIVALKIEMETKIKEATTNKMDLAQINTDIKRISLEKENFKALIEDLAKKSMELDNLICLSPEQMAQEIEELKAMKEKLDIKMDRFPDELMQLKQARTVYTESYKLVTQINGVSASLKKSYSLIQSYQDELQQIEKGTVESYMKRLRAELENKRLIKEEFMLNIKNYESNKKEFNDLFLRIPHNKKELLKVEEERISCSEKLKHLKLQHNEDAATIEQLLDRLVGEQENILKSFEEKKEHIENTVNILIKNLQSI